MIIKALREDHRVRVSPSTLRQYLRQELGLRYRVLGVVGPHFDDLNNLLMRQLSASECIKALTEGKEIINVDESILRSSDSRRRGWVLAKSRILASHALRLPQISMIAGISSRGRVFFTLNQGKNNSATFSYFLSKLISLLDSKGGGWRANTLILLDNAPIHRSRESIAFQESAGLSVMFLAPYSFRMAAVEKLFSFVKNRDLNPLAVRKYTR